MTMKMRVVKLDILRVHLCERGVNDFSIKANVNFWKSIQFSSLVHLVKTSKNISKMKFVSFYPQKFNSGIIFEIIFSKWYSQSF